MLLKYLFTKWCPQTTVYLKRTTFTLGLVVNIILSEKKSSKSNLFWRTAIMQKFKANIMFST